MLRYLDEIGVMETFGFTALMLIWGAGRVLVTGLLLLADVLLKLLDLKWGDEAKVGSSTSFFTIGRLQGGQCPALEGSGGHRLFAPHPIRHHCLSPTLTVSGIYLSVTWDSISTSYNWCLSFLYLKCNVLWLYNVLQKSYQLAWSYELLIKLDQIIYW